MWPTDNKYTDWLSFIERSHLFFETREELICFLRGTKERNRPNSVVRNNRSETRIKRDYEKLEELAHQLTDGEISKVNIFDPNATELSAILDIYSKAVKSNSFLSPRNTRDGFSKVQSGSFYYEGVYTPKKLAALIVEFLQNPKPESEHLYKRLGLKIRCNESLLDNYKCAIGLLLLIGALPLTTDKTRFRGSAERLTEDTAKMVSLLCCIRGEFSRVLGPLTKDQRPDNWCRLLLIQYTVAFLNAAARRFDPRLTEERGYVGRYPFEEYPLWRSGSNGKYTYYEFKRPPKNTEYTAYVYRYRYESNTLIKERFSLVFYERIALNQASENRSFASLISQRQDYRVMKIFPIDHTYLLLTSKDNTDIKPGECEGLYEIKGSEEKLELTLIPPEGVKWMERVTLTPITDEEMPKGYTLCKTKDLAKAEENLFVGSLDAIFRDKLVFKTDDGSFRTIADHILKEILPKIHITDTINLYHLEDKDYLLMTVDGKIDRVELPSAPF
jgi:hypothetical protein